MRRYVAAGIWLVFTVTATLIVWAAVSVVAADVTDRPAPVVGHRDVVVALQAGSSHSATTTTVTTVVPRPVPANPLLPAPTPTTTTVTRPTSSTLSPAPASRATTTTILVSPPTTAKTTVHPPAPTTTLATGATATYSTAGGVVAVACTGPSSIRLVAALPYDGFQARIVSGGPFFVAIGFVSPDRSVSVGAACLFGLPFESTDGQGPAGATPTTNPSGG